MRTAIPYLDSARKLLQASGPYLLLELLLPGGTMIALLLFLYRRKGSRLAAFVQRLARLGESGAVRRATERVMLPLDVYAWARQVDADCKRPKDGLEAFEIAPACTRACRKGDVIAVHW